MILKRGVDSTPRLDIGALQCRRGPGFGDFDISPTALARRAGKVQCLGEMPWVKPGDCFRARLRTDHARRTKSQEPDIGRHPTYLPPAALPKYRLRHYDTLS